VASAAEAASGERLPLVRNTLSYPSNVTEEAWGVEVKFIQRQNYETNLRRWHGVTRRQKRKARGGNFLTLRLVICQESGYVQCAYSELQVDGAETEKVRELKLLVMPEMTK